MPPRSSEPLIFEIGQEGRANRYLEQGKTLGLTHNLGGMPGDCVSFVSVVGSELG